MNRCPNRGRSTRTNVRRYLSTDSRCCWQSAPGTSGASVVEANGSTVAALLADLDARYPGIRFRMINEADALRPHVRVFVNRESITNLESALSPDDEAMILQALSGG